MNDHAAAPPQGFVTLLFTDIEGSTARWEKYGPRFGAILADHERIMREAIAACNGYEVKTIGDAFMVAFSDPLHAVQCAAQVQEALKIGNETEADWKAAEGIRIRIGIHCGEPDCRGSDYFGPVVNRAARISDTGQGGMIVLSQAAADAVRDRLPAPLELEDCGPRRLKDLTDPQPLFVLWLGTETERRPVVLRTLQAEHNLPGQMNAFVGRSRERRELAKILRIGDERLITLTGPGGTGKTRLSLQIAADQAHLFPGGIWFIELAGVRNPDELPAALALSLKLPLRPGVEPRLQIAAFLRERKKRCLLVLDNFEQIVDAALLVSDLLRECPLLTCLVSSRELLLLSSEREYPLDPLAVPSAAASAETLPGCESVQLFMARGQTARADFALAAENAPIIAEICRRLEGLPLSIELAAAQIRRLTPHDILTKLSHRLDALQSQFRDLTPRQRTLRGAIDWSHELLSAEEQTSFSELAVFAGGFFAEAAEAVCREAKKAEAREQRTENRRPETEAAALHGAILPALRDKSLLRAEMRDGAVRYSMLETIREYAQEKADADFLPALRSRHAAYFETLAAPLSRKLMGGEADAHEANERLTLELDNIRAGMDWTCETGQDAAAASYGNALTRFLIKRGLYPECEQRLTQAEEAAERCGDRAALAILLNRHGLAAQAVSHFDAAYSYFRQCYRVSKAAGDTLLLESALSNLGGLAWRRSDYDAAQQFWEEARLLATAEGHERLEADVCGSLGSLSVSRGAFEEAARYLERSLEIRRRQNHLEGIAVTLYQQAFLFWRQGERETALAQAREAQRAFGELELKDRLALTNVQISQFLRETGPDAEAETAAQDALTTAQAIGYALGEMYALDALGCLAAKRDEWEKAKSHFLDSIRMACEMTDRKHCAITLWHFGAMQAARTPHEESYLALSLAARLAAELRLIDAAAIQADLTRAQSGFSAEILARLDAQAALLTPETWQEKIKY